MKNLNEDPQNLITGHKVISANIILNNDKEQIKILLTQLAHEYNVSERDIAFALANVLQRIATTNI